MKLKLKNYQKKIVEFCKTTDKVILSVGMGLGKTAAAPEMLKVLQDIVEGLYPSTAE